ncbi:hypothetical protein CAEBREN_19790 [Caenorhabditis brenneri]|uniref:FHA domain-containing protein n=1 Tax=Caenorhabditis brenneri TaxID=135651 RepID=G0MJ59_CAEBE|nr:hypothetical protein CAEBREN_19790 [Caenorhabditis brenneri]
MGDKLDMTINEVASMDRKVVIPKFEAEIEVPSFQEHVQLEKEASRKRKFHETPEAPDRPNALDTRKKWKFDEYAPFEAGFEECKPSTSAAAYEDAQSQSCPSSMERSSIEEEVNTEEEKEDSEEKEDKNSQREPSLTETDPMKIWTAADDYALIVAISHVSCLKFIHNSMPFSRKFTRAELEERYSQLMYDEKMSEQAKGRIALMKSREKICIESRTPFSREEEKCLMEAAELVLKSQKGERYDPDNHTVLQIEHFKQILKDNRTSFHKSRNPQVLSDHFRRIKSYREPKNSPYTYEAFENPTNGWVMDFDLMRPLQECRTRYHAIAKRPALRGIQSRFQTSSTVPDNAVAMIHGRFLQYAMTGSVVIMGRSSINERVDIDLSKEGPAAKVSRQQAVISHDSEHNFTIQNIGQRAIYVDSKPLPQMVATSLRHGSVIEVASIRLNFHIPVPRVLHPLTMKVAMQHRKAQAEKQQKQMLSLQRGGPPPSLPPQQKKPRVKPPTPIARKPEMHPVERLMGAGGGGGGALKLSPAN